MWRFSLLLTALVFLASCGKSPIFGECPQGFRLDENVCVCATDGACPDNLSCVDGECRCQTDECCPAGFALGEPAEDGTEQCFCATDECCSDGERFDAEANVCVCESSECCPPDTIWSEDEQACLCAGDECCPTGFLWDDETEACNCDSDSCCPVGYRFEPRAEGCTCANDECCPEDHLWSDTALACVCQGVGCCPEGFESRPDGTCACATDSACPFGLTCDAAEGRCLCTTDESCGRGFFCNSFGSCQSLEACTSNLDCPTGTFCDTEERRCLPDGTCGQDIHCPQDAICDRDQNLCTTGCNTTEDCVLDSVCAQGQCNANACDMNADCQLRSFCDVDNQTCGPPNQSYCADCGDTQPCELSVSCIQYIIEGDTTRGVCAVFCGGDEDCPGGMVCADVYFRCSPESGGRCEGDAVCLETEVLNQERTFYCSDPLTGRPKIMRNACAPRAGDCSL